MLPNVHFPRNPVKLFQDTIHKLRHYITNYRFLTRVSSAICELEKAKYITSLLAVLFQLFWE